MAASERFVHLPSTKPHGGLTMPVEPVILQFDLKQRGFSLLQDGEALVVRPHERLTPEDRVAIRRWKPHILALLAYDQQEVQ